MVCFCTYWENWLVLSVRYTVYPDCFFILCYQAVETLKTFEKKDSRVKSAAATNLSFLYFLVSSSH